MLALNFLGVRFTDDITLLIQQFDNKHPIHPGKTVQLRRALKVVEGVSRQYLHEIPKRKQGLEQSDDQWLAITSVDATWIAQSSTFHPFQPLQP